MSQVSTNSPKDALHHAIINRVSEATVSKLHKRGLLALYLGGTFLTSDRLSSSDIDLLGIVAKTFDFCEEDHLNSYFDESVEPEVGIKSCFRGITISELKGGIQKGNATSWIPIRIMIKRLPFYMHLWGIKFNFTTFPIKPYPPKEEAGIHFIGIKRSIKSIRRKNGKLRLSPQAFAKQVLHLAFVEAEVAYGFKFTPSYEGLIDHLKDRKDHFAHRALEMRKAEAISTEEYLAFCDQAERYISNLKKLKIRKYDGRNDE